MLILCFVLRFPNKREHDLLQYVFQKTLKRAAQHNDKRAFLLAFSTFLDQHEFVLLPVYSIVKTRYAKHSYLLHFAFVFFHIFQITNVRLQLFVFEISRREITIPR